MTDVNKLNEMLEKVFVHSTDALLNALDKDEIPRNKNEITNFELFSKLDEILSVLKEIRDK